MPTNRVDRDVQTKGFYANIPRTMIVPMPDPNWEYFSDAHIPDSNYLEDQDVLHGLPLGGAIGRNVSKMHALKKEAAEVLNGLPDGGAIVLQMQYHSNFFVGGSIYGSGKTCKEAVSSGSPADAIGEGSTFGPAASRYFWVIKTSRPLTPVEIVKPAKKPAAKSNTGKKVRVIRSPINKAWIWADGSSAEGHVIQNYTVSLRG